MCSDLISRQDVLDAVNDCGICIQRILDIPSAEPERKWIPVTERLPEDMDRLLATIVRADGSKRVRSGHYYKGLFMMDNGDTWNATDKGVLAWMPLPEPWRGDR